LEKQELTLSRIFRGLFIVALAMNLALWIGLGVLTAWPSIVHLYSLFFGFVVGAAGLVVGTLFTLLVWPRAAWFRAPAAVENVEEAKRWCEC